MPVIIFLACFMTHTYTCTLNYNKQKPEIFIAPKFKVFAGTIPEYWLRPKKCCVSGNIKF